MTKQIYLGLLAILLVSACSALNPSLDRPAIISDANEMSNQLITHAIANLLHGARVEVAEDVFTQSSSIVVHRSLLAGRDLGVVDNFRLVINKKVLFSPSKYLEQRSDARFNMPRIGP